MNTQRKIIITTTYNELGIIIDTKVEEVAQPNLQPTCNQLATDTINRQQAIDAITEYGSGDTTYMSVAELKRRIEHFPSIQPDIILCPDCRYNDGTAYCELHFRDVKAKDYCSWAERRKNANND